MEQQKRGKMKEASNETTTIATQCFGNVVRGSANDKQKHFSAALKLVLDSM